MNNCRLIIIIKRLELSERNLDKTIDITIHDIKSHCWIILRQHFTLFSIVNFIIIFFINKVCGKNIKLCKILISMSQHSEIIQKNLFRKFIIYVTKNSLFVYFNLYKCTNWAGVLGVARGIIFLWRKHIFENTCRECKIKIQPIQSCRLASYSYNIPININIYWFTKYKYLSARAVSYKKIYIFFSIECCAVILFYYVNVDMHMVLIRSIGSVKLTKQSSSLQSSSLNSPVH